MCLNEPIEMETTCDPLRNQSPMLQQIHGGMRVNVKGNFTNLFPKANPIKFIGLRAIIRISKKNTITLVFSDKAALCTIKRFIRDCGWKA
jgi:hypothetical protein